MDSTSSNPNIFGNNTEKQFDCAAISIASMRLR